MKKCKNADAYQAMQPPRCNGGRPCDACVEKWQAAQRRRIVKANKGTRHEAAVTKKYGDDSVDTTAATAAALAAVVVMTS